MKSNAALSCRNLILQKSTTQAAAATAPEAAKAQAEETLLWLLEATEAQAAEDPGAARLWLLPRQPQSSAP